MCMSRLYILNIKTTAHGAWYMVHGFDQTLELNQCDPAFSFKLKQQQESFLTANLPSFKSLL